MKATSSNIRVIRYWLVPVVFFLVPVVSIVAAGNTQWVGRLIAVSVVISFSVPILLWYALDPKAQFTRKKAKLNQPAFKKVKPREILVMRAILFILALLLLEAAVLGGVTGALIQSQGVSDAVPPKK